MVCAEALGREERKKKSNTRCSVLPSEQRVLLLRESKEKKEFFGYFLPATIRYHLREKG